MISITDAQVERYIYGLLPESPSVLKELELEAKKGNVPIVGPMVGRLLHILARISKARRVLEIGTAIGYSAIWFGLAVKQNRGKVITIEIDEAIAEKARRNIRQAGLRNIVRVLNGDGLQVISKVKGKFDIIFVDDTKENYPKYLEKCVSKLNKNGLLLADNALWMGEVALNPTSEEGRAIADFNIKLMKKMHSVIIPARDGVAIGVK